MAVVGLLTQTLCFPVAKADSVARPNIVLILADDMGWGDPQCYQPGSKIPTPNLDRLAAEGMRFTDAHTPSSVCTPTRYGLLTGRYCWRTWLDKGVLDGFGPPLIGPNESTLAKMLGEQGYSTACVGKWHLGMQWHNLDGKPIGVRGPNRFRPGDDVDFKRDTTGGPNDVGFDQYFGISASLDMSPYAYLRNRRVESLPTNRHEEIKGTIFLNGVSGVESPGFDVHQVLGRLADEAVGVIAAAGANSRPFFLYLPLTSPHLPVAPSAQAAGKSKAGRYGDFVWETDHVVGRVMQALRDSGQEDQTLVIFTSDNGGLWHWWDFHADDDGGEIPITPRGDYVKQLGHQSNAHWRGTKADIYEGGHRVPFIVRWPGTVAPGQVCDQLIELTDIYATLAEIADQPVQQGTSGADSFSFLPLLKGKNEATRPFAIHHSIRGTFALRRGQLKLIEGRGSGGFTKPRVLTLKPGDPPGQLYNLGEDPQERVNLWQARSEDVKAMQKLLDAVRSSSARAVAIAP
jgi:arylsulfatase A-like enzyme